MEIDEPPPVRLDYRPSPTSTQAAHTWASSPRWIDRRRAWLRAASCACPLASGDAGAQGAVEVDEELAGGVALGDFPPGGEDGAGAGYEEGAGEVEALVAEHGLALGGAAGGQGDHFGSQGNLGDGCGSEAVVVVGSGVSSR